jgi:hypothetical protein
MCKCLSEKEQFVKENISKERDNFKNIEVTDVNFKHQGETFLSCLDIPIIIKGTKTNTKGERVGVKKELYYPAIYCPFCGEKFE